MQAKASPKAIVDAQFVHPTFSEGVQSVVMKLKRFSLSLMIEQLSGRHVL